MYVRGYLQGSENGRVATIAYKTAESAIVSSFYRWLMIPTQYKYDTQTLI